MKKVVVKLSFQDDKIKQKPMKAVSSVEGIVSFSLDGEKMTVIGNMDPLQVVKKLRKWYPQLDTVGPSKEEKKGENKAAGSGGGADNKPIGEAVYYPPLIYPVYSLEENPNSCVIC